MAELDPGQTLTEDYIVVPNFTGTLDTTDSFVTGLSAASTVTAGGTAIPWSIASQQAPDPTTEPTVTATPEADGIHVSWQPVAGALGYEVFSTPAYQTDFPTSPAATVDGTTTSAVIPSGDSGLIAVSTILAGPSGTPTPTLVHPLLAVSPYGAPLAPTDVTVTYSGTSATVKWKAPPSNGAKVTGYVVYPYLNGRPVLPVPFSSTAKSETLAGLTAGGSYTFAVAATSSAGTGPTSSASTPIVIGAPSAPAAPKAKVKSGMLTVTWKAPKSTGGSPVTGYVLTPYIGTVAQTPIVVTTPATSQVVTGLVSGTRYTFTVAAVNALSTGSPSPASAGVTAP